MKYEKEENRIKYLCRYKSSGVYSEICPSSYVSANCLPVLFCDVFTLMCLDYKGAKYQRAAESSSQNKTPFCDDFNLHDTKSQLSSTTLDGKAERLEPTFTTYISPSSKGSDRHFLSFVFFGLKRSFQLHGGKCLRRAGQPEDTRTTQVFLWCDIKGTV